MKRKILKLFWAYSYVSLLMYVTSEQTLTLAKRMKEKGKGTAGTLKFESLWKTTFKRFKESYTMLDD